MHVTDSTRRTRQQARHPRSGRPKGAHGTDVPTSHR
eukprot:CAMPEP_0206317824 /NCGR_PEP_ID=MMETSP0106_2-20121207/16841_1 /ASSEMBLY_ACC=CAM_ASM_000206 /TAXON_ID=81532 /ORGANISM="Acanthoeca-like sp., Strain 10tr" /LENGTH=35 /DNA_ID= /DNA_START= /DNA_END= /DNA_ORIENTATION=